MRTVLLTAALALSALAQTPPPPTFEVASIKPTQQSQMLSGRIMVRMSTDAGRVTYSNVALRNIITTAFRIKDHQLTAPDWVNTTRFDINAKIPDGVNKEQVPEMLQALLAERFHLQFHKEEKTAPVYALIQAKGGIKLAKADAAAQEQKGTRMMMSPKGRRMTGNITMDTFANTISNMLDRPVIDMTESKDIYDFDLEWTPDETENMGKMGMVAVLRPSGPAGPLPGGPGAGGPGAGGPGAGGPPPEGAPKGDAPNLFGAVQNIGLKLDPRKAPMTMFVVDNLDKSPTEN